MSSSDEKSGEDGSERPGPFAALFQEIGEMRQEQITIRDMLCGQGSREGNDGVEATAMVVKAPKAPRRLVVPRGGHSTRFNSWTPKPETLREVQHQAEMKMLRVRLEAQHEVEMMDLRVQFETARNENRHLAELCRSQRESSLGL
ncbi:hypothetical protein FPOA_07048 [Fusarium poae]|uniref:Uncharacterized protein n=1 Tax=Fusarium poae TaxID=36050 RepID=A0A1B8AJI6_FUSPO|nr:hypothetical protein FPOA_07048 [Fusarium poae]